MITDMMIRNIQLVQSGHGSNSIRQELEIDNNRNRIVRNEYNSNNYSNNEIYMMLTV